MHLDDKRVTGPDDRILRQPLTDDPLAAAAVRIVHQVRAELLAAS